MKMKPEYHFKMSYTLIALALGQLWSHKLFQYQIVKSLTASGLEPTTL